MKRYRAKRASRVVVIMAVAVAFISVLATSSLAQRRMRGSRGIESPETLETRQRESVERSRALERAGAPNNPYEPEPMSPRLRRMLVLAQIREDLGRIQDVHQDLMNTTAVAHALDYKRISETTEEIRRRAIRLKTNLAFSEAEKGKKSRTSQDLLDTEQVKESLPVLSDLIIGFVTNPLFQDSNVIDAQLSTKANRDLERIIELSRRIRKSVERLDKTAKHSKSS